MKMYCALISLWISVVLFSNVAVAVDTVNVLGDDAIYRSPRIINPRIEHINERLSGKLENRFQSSCREVTPPKYDVWNRRLLPGMDAKVHAETDMKNYYYAAASETTVYDDSGSPITEAEIRLYMIDDYRTGCCLLGCLVGSGASSILGCVASVYMAEALDLDEDTKMLLGITTYGVIATVSPLLGYKAGKEIDRLKAIELIKEERRTGKKPPQPKREFLPKVVMGFGAVGAAIIIIPIVMSIVGD